MDFIKYVALFVITVGGFIVAILSWLKTRYEEEKTPSWIGLVTLITGIFIILGGLVSGIVQYKSDDDKSKLTEQILNSTKENARLSQAINNITTGGDSYCYITFEPWETNIKTLHGNINHEGTFPLYDLTITLHDMIKYRELETKVDSKSGYYVGDQNKIMKTINIGNINPGSNIVNMWRLHLPHLLKVDNYKEYKVNVFYAARNGSWVQLVRLKKVGRLGGLDYWAQAITVRRDKEVLFEYIDAKYPRNINGKVEW